MVVDSLVCISRSLSIAFGWGQIMRGDNGNRCVRLCGSLARNAHSSGPLNRTLLYINVLTVWYHVEHLMYLLSFIYFHTKYLCPIGGTS